MSQPLYRVSTQNPQQRDSQIDCHSDAVSVHNEATSLWQSTDWGIVFVDSKYLPFYPSVNVKSKCAEHNDKTVKILGKSEKSTLGNKCVITKLNFKEKKKMLLCFAIVTASMGHQASIQLSS